MEDLSAARVPAAYARHIGEAFGTAGTAWLERLPAVLVDLAQQWQLAWLGEPFELSYNYVVPARRVDGTLAVLKVGSEQPQAVRESAALRTYAGDGACRLIEADDARWAMLLERVVPGETLVARAQTDDAEATRIGARVLRQLWRPLPAESLANFRPVAEWFQAFDRHRVAYGGSGPLAARVFDAAVQISAALLASAPEPVLLHGDFHHYNVLSATRAGWLAIDPKGVTGDPGYDVGPWLCNPRPSDGWSPHLLPRRLDILAEELEYDRARLRDWGIAYGVLSACWSVEDHEDDWQNAILTAETLLAP